MSHCSYCLRVLLFFLLAPVFAVEAGIENVQNHGSKLLEKKIKHNWADLSHDEYLTNLVVCQLKIQELKWQKYIWPTENKNPKPSFREVVNVQQAFQSVNTLLKKQAVLGTYFNIAINDSNLQTDINRMVIHTKDTESLSALFAVLSNQPNTIAECISRPNVVNQYFDKAYSRDKAIHQGTKQRAEADLLAIKDKSYDSVTAKMHHIIYELDQVSGKQDLNQIEQKDFKGYVDQLDYKQFQLKKNELSFGSLKETDQVFYFSKSISHSENHIEFKTWVWEKQTPDSWLNQQKSVTGVRPQSGGEFILPSFNQKKWQAGEKSHNAGNWWAPQSTPNGMSRHTAVWTGNHLIVWGGEFLGSIRGWNYDPITDLWTQMSNDNAPVNRRGHTAVWTGSQMIVWGGNQSNTFFQSGGLYDPLTNSWTSINTTGAPDARTNHTAVWTGNQMIVWGGYGNFPQVYNSGGVYDPVADQWTAMSLANAPQERYEHTAVWTDDKMIVWGGYSSYPNTLNTGGIYDPALDQWTTTTTTNAPSNRFGHEAVWTGSKMIIWGGNAIEYGASDDYLNTGGLYDPVMDSWTATSTTNSPSRRLSASSVWSGSQMIIFGGRYYYYDFELDMGEDVYLTSGKLYDPVNDVWSNINGTSQLEERALHTAVWTGTEMLVWGGANNNGRLNSGGKYNPIGNSWIKTGPLNLPGSRENHVGVWTGNEMFVWGGNIGELFLRTGGLYEPSTDTWSTTNLNNSPDVRIGSTAVWTGSEVIVWGGFDGGGFPNLGKRYDPINNTWAAISGVDVPDGRISHTAIWTGNEMLIWGGDQFGNGRLNTGGLYDPVLDAWTATDVIGAPLAASEHSAVWTGDKMIVWGGVTSGGSRINSGGVYDLSQDTWSFTNAVSAPPARSSHSAVWTGDSMIVWGGVNGGTAEGFIYDPINDQWSSTSFEGAPSNRSYHTAVWTGLKMIVWGGVGSNYERTGGMYDPFLDSWVTTSLVNAPSARSYHTAIWTSNEMIIWGGTSNVMGVFTPHGSYHISGVLNGLNGDQIILQNNGADDLVLTENGAFTFSQSVDEGMGYNISVLTSPQSPSQTCSITNGAFAHVISDINDVEVNCVNDFFNLGAIVTGLADGNELGLLNSGVDALTIDTNNQLTHFPTQVGNGQDYLVTIDSQPSTPNQTCTINPGEESGTINDADAEVNIECVTNQYMLGVDVSGLQQGDLVSFTNDFNQYLPIENDGLYMFDDPYDDGTAFQVNLILQPVDPYHVCSFVNPNSGLFKGMDQHIEVICVDTDLIFGHGFE